MQKSPRRSNTQVILKFREDSSINKFPSHTPDASLEARLRRVEADKAGTYTKRTEHLDGAGNALFINRLILEDSPYLLQHAHNPVNWYAWGTEAFEAARIEHKPVFLSIGYSTCHWCHVMEVESFDNVEVAKILNAHFISIKLDREQFPDIDEVYMTGVQIMSGHGGWPMSNFLLPDGKPFFGATYFPAAGFMQLLRQVVDAFENKYAELEKSANQINEAIARYLSARKPPVELDPDLAEAALQALLQREDRSYGGLAGAPKFPQEPILLWMLDRVARNRELVTLAFIERALEGMASGGIYDQVAGGFHRYSVDAQWLVPHFEKMLYNQSQLGLVYLQAWQITDNEFFRRVCEQTLAYVVRDMQIPEGGFYSATDADSEGREGTFFVWSNPQLEALLSAAELQLLHHVYDISSEGNFEGLNILSLRKSLAQLARESGRDDFYQALDAILGKLFQAREQRVPPLRDDKRIVAWNAAMITTLARAAYALDNSNWLAVAERAAASIWQYNVVNDASGLHLSRIYLNGAVSIAGQLEDYANLAEALLVLFDVTANVEYLQRSALLFSAARREFQDVDSGNFFLSPARRDGPLLARSLSAADGATVSAVATALRCMLALQSRSALWQSPQTGFTDLQPGISSCINSLSAALNESPLGHTSMLRAVAQQQRGSIDNIQYAAHGLARLAVRKQMRTATSAKIKLVLNLQPGWHVTAQVGGRHDQSSAGQSVQNPGAFEVRIADDEAHWQLAACETAGSAAFPAGGNPAAQVADYAGDVEFTLEFSRTSAKADALTPSIGFEVGIQLCNEHSCLLPDTLQFRC